jgi:hypothetical protein
MSANNMPAATPIGAPAVKPESSFWLRAINCARRRMLSDNFFGFDGFFNLFLWHIMHLLQGS